MTNKLIHSKGVKVGGKVRDKKTGEWGKVEYLKLSPKDLSYSQSYPQGFPRALQRVIRQSTASTTITTLINIY